MSERRTSYEIERYSPHLGRWVASQWYKVEENGPPETKDAALALCQFMEALRGGVYSYHVVKVTREVVE